MHEKISQLRQNFSGLLIASLEASLTLRHPPVVASAVLSFSELFCVVSKCGVSLNFADNALL